MKSVKILFVLIIVLASSLYLQGQNPSNRRKLDLKVLFEINNNNVDRYYSNNESIFETLDSIFFNSKTVEKIRTIEIFSSASIDGSYEHNQDLSNKRIVAVRDENDAVIVETGSDRSRLLVKRWAIGTVETVHDDAE